jgi:replicative DNA helicase
MEQKTLSKKFRYPQRIANPVPALVNNELGRVPPQAIDLEEAVLGAVLLEKNALTSVVSFLKPEHFYTSAHELIYKAVIQLFQSASPVDMRTVVMQLRKNGELELAGGAYYIAELTSKVSSAANIEYHARIVVEMAIKRTVITIGHSMSSKGYEDSMDVFALLDFAESSIFNLLDSNMKGEVKKMPGLIQMALANIIKRGNNGSGLTGTPSGLTMLDKVTDGWQKSDLVIIAARPGMGKTAMITTMLRNAAVDHNIPVALFSLEMASLQITNRLICSEAEVESDKLKKAQFTKEEWERVLVCTRRLESAPLFIDDTAALSILELRAKCRRLKMQNNVQLIVVDYLQLMKGDSEGNREQEIASISRALKGIAKELDVPVIALSQLSRGVETRGGDKRPQLSDLRESGSIEQDADVVMFLYRPEYYKITVDEEGMPTDGKAEAIIAKHRNGSLDTVPLKFIGKYTKFINYDLTFNSHFQ